MMYFRRFFPMCSTRIVLNFNVTCRDWKIRKTSLRLKLSKFKYIRYVCPYPIVWYLKNLVITYARCTLQYLYYEYYILRSPMKNRKLFFLLFTRNRKRSFGGGRTYRPKRERYLRFWWEMRYARTTL